MLKYNDDKDYCIDNDDKNYCIDTNDTEDIDDSAAYNDNNNELDDDDMLYSEMYESIGQSSEMPSDMTMYLSEIAKYELLTPEKESELAKNTMLGDTESRNKLVNHNLRLVINIAKRYQGSGLDIMDLIQAGNIGLMKAADRFDYTRGFRFSTYATWWIRQSIVRTITDTSKTIRIPVHMSEKINKARKVKMMLTQELKREPSVNEVALELGISVEQYIELLQYSDNMVSLDSPLFTDDGDCDSCLGDFIANSDCDIDPEVMGTRTELIKVINDVLNSTKFSDKERDIIRMRFGMYPYDEVHTLEQVGHKYNVTRERIRQVEAKAIRKLRHPSICNQLKDFIA